MKKLLFTLLMGMVIPYAFGQVKDNTLSDKEKAEHWKLLFDGTTSTGWTTVDGKSIPADWDLSNGAMTLKKGANGGDIYTADEYTNFQFSVDFKIEPGTNTGIKYLCTKYEKGGNLGMECQIIDDVLGEDNKQPNHLLGSLYDILPPDESIKKVNPPGQWNTMLIIVKGKRIEHWLNGVEILDYVRGSKAYNDGVAASKFSKVEPAFGMVEKGRIQLQDHHGPVSFKNIKIRVM